MKKGGGGGKRTLEGTQPTSPPAHTARRTPHAAPDAGRAPRAQADVSSHAETTRRVRHEAQQEALVRAAEAGALHPLQSRLRESEEALAEAHAQKAGASLLAERLQTLEAERVAEREAAEAADLRAAAAARQAQSSKELLGQVEAELGRRDARSAALKRSLEAANAELALMRSAKDLLEARHELRLTAAQQQQHSASPSAPQRPADETQTL